MEDAFLKWDIAEKKNFNKRMIPEIGINILFCTLLWLVGSNATPGGALLLSLLVFFILLAKGYRTEKNYITHIEFSASGIQIKYKRESDELILEGYVADFSFKKKIAFSKMRSTYLVVYHKKNALIKQYETGEWTEKKFDELIRQSELLKGEYYSPL